MNFDISPAAATPIYRQIVEQARRLIASGQLQSGDTLPSVRAVALHHAINPMTVSKAYSLLEAEGVLQRTRGMGMTVAAAGTVPTVQSRRDLLRPSVMAAVQVARQLELSDADALALFTSCLLEPKEQPS